MTREDAIALFHLQRLWMGTYAIGRTDEGTWTARPYRRGATTLTAGTAPDLQWLMRTDYGDWLRTSRLRA